MDERYKDEHEIGFHGLLGFLAAVPAISTNDSAFGGFGSGKFENGNWWVKFSIDTQHSLAWKTVQELGHVLNYLSVEDPLPTCFKPVSPPPYMNGGPDEYLSWVVESSDPEFLPVNAKEWLAARLPNPVNDLSAWSEE